MNGLMPIPTLHDALLPAWCRGVSCADPIANAGGLLTGLPLSAAEAKAVLAEWKAKSAGELLAEVQQTATAPADAFTIPGEDEALRRFCGQSTDNGETLRRAQRMLLLGYAQEENAIEMRELQEREAEQRAKLRRLLDDDEESACSWNEQRSETTGSELLPSWRGMLQHLAPFVAADAVLLVTDPRLAAELAFSGAEDLPENLELPDGLHGIFRAARTTFDQLLRRHIIGGETERLFVFRI